MVIYTISRIRLKLSCETFWEELVQHLVGVVILHNEMMDEMMMVKPYTSHIIVKFVSNIQLLISFLTL